MKKIMVAALLLSLAVCPDTFGQAKKHRSIMWEKFQASGPGLKQAGTLAVRPSKEIESSQWSVGCETLDRDYADFQVYKNYVGELGVKHGRLQSGWAKCEKEKGIYNFAWLDSCVYGLNEQSVKPWICLCYSNPIYGGGTRLGTKIFTDDETMSAWLKYVEATIVRYKDVVNEWEVWNEPNGANGSKEYANLLIKTAETIKRIQPDATVYGFALDGIALKFAEEVFEILKDNNKLGLVDGLTYHPYIKNPDDSYADVEKLRKLANSYNPKIKLYQGENGCPSILEWTHALSNYPWTEISQAKWLMRRMAADHVRGIPTSVFTIIDLQYWNMLQSFGLIRSNILHNIIYKRPSYYGVQNMVNFFDDSVKPAGELPFKTNSKQELAVAGFTKGSGPVLLIWDKSKIPGDSFDWNSVNLEVKGVKFSDPVFVEMVSGKVYELKKGGWKNSSEGTSFKGLPVWDSVVMIAERSQVKIIP